MSRGVLTALAFAVLLAGPASTAPSPVAADRIWFCPGPGTIDYVRLFQHPEEWRHARAVMDVFKFYQGHTQTPPPSSALPNSYDALVAAGAFRTVSQWGKKIALENGAVKEFYCTPDASGMNRSIADTVDSIRAVEAAGGTVSYIAMDDPFAAGRAPVCGGPDPEPTADRIATYVRGVHARFPDVQIGLIDAYPLSSEARLETILDLLQARGVAPAFFHADVDSRALRPGGPAEFTRDMRALRQACAARNIPFGILIWGYNGDSDMLYALDADKVVGEITQTFTNWNDMPDHLIVQSFAVSATGQFITPSNLPEDQPYTHTRLLWNIYRRLRGENGPVAGAAVIRR
jgi:hypothetical protein